MDKVPVVEDKAFTLYLEEYNNLLFIHCDVYKWLKSTRKKMEIHLDFLLKKYNPHAVLLVSGLLMLIIAQILNYNLTKSIP